jgi:hypothetical protein
MFKYTELSVNLGSLLHVNIFSLIKLKTGYDKANGTLTEFISFVF